MTKENLFIVRSLIADYTCRHKDQKEWIKYLAKTYDCSIATVRYEIHWFNVCQIYGPTRLISTLAEKKFVKDRDNSTCQYCGVINPKFHAVEHVIPCLKGGITNTCNLVFACKSCNKKKGDSIWTPKNINLLALENKEWSLKIQYNSVRRYNI